MRFYDFWAGSLHEILRIKSPWHRVLCFFGLHNWSYMGPIECRYVGTRYYWHCSNDHECQAEKWLLKEEI